MFKGKPKIAKPAGMISDPMPPSGKPKGMGRRKPHSGQFTRGSCDTRNGEAIASGLNKISVFFTGKAQYKPVKPKVFKNPFTKVMNTILGRK